MYHAHVGIRHSTLFLLANETPTLSTKGLKISSVDNSVLHQLNNCKCLGFSRTRVIHLGCNDRIRDISVSYSFHLKML